jgi:hypothetical protein
MRHSEASDGNRKLELITRVDSDAEFSQTGG